MLESFFIYHVVFVNRYFRLLLLLLLTFVTCQPGPGPENISAIEFICYTDIEHYVVKCCNVKSVKIVYEICDVARS